MGATLPPQGEVAYGSGDTRATVLRLTDEVGGADEGSEIGGRATVCGAGQNATYESETAAC
jgi:hypothetical protein